MAGEVIRREIAQPLHLLGLAVAGRDRAGHWGGGLARLIMVLAAGGMRFSQAVRMRVSDVQAARLMVPVSRKGSIAKATTHIAVPVAPDVISALKPAVNDRDGHEPLLMRPGGFTPAARLHGSSAPTLCRCAGRRSAASLGGDRRSRAGMSATVTPYSLRHSSIARSLKAGLPVQLVARLHDTSAVQIEKAYSREIVSLMDDLARRAVINLLPASVTPIAAVRST